MGEVIALDVAVTLGDGTMYTCLQIRDFTPLEPDVNEFKYYAPGVGVALEEVVDGDERVELIGVGSSPFLSANSRSHPSASSTFSAPRRGSQGSL